MEEDKSGHDGASSKLVKRPPVWIPGATGWLWASAFSVTGMFFAWGNPLTKVSQFVFWLWALTPYVFAGWWLFSGKFKIRRDAPLRKLPQMFVGLTVFIYWVPMFRAAFESTGEFVLFAPLPFWLTFGLLKGAERWLR